MSTPLPPGPHPGSRPGPRPAGTARQRAPRGARWLGAVLLLLPVVEIVVAIQAGRLIGAGGVVLWLIAAVILGAVIVRRAGAASWRSLDEAARSGRPPTRELADSALSLVGGVLLIVPGFVSDVVGLVLVLPFTRAPARRLLALWLGRSVARQFGAAQAAAFRGGVIEGEVVDVQVQDLPQHLRHDDEGRPPLR